MNKSNIGNQSCIIKGVLLLRKYNKCFIFVNFIQNKKHVLSVLY